MTTAILRTGIDDAIDWWEENRDALMSDDVEIQNIDTVYRYIDRVKEKLALNDYNSREVREMGWEAINDIQASSEEALLRLTPMIQAMPPGSFGLSDDSDEIDVICDRLLGDLRRGIDPQDVYEAYVEGDLDDSVDEYLRTNNITMESLNNLDGLEPEIQARILCVLYFHNYDRVAFAEGASSDDAYSYGIDAMEDISDQCDIDLAEIASEMGRDVDYFEDEDFVPNPRMTRDEYANAIANARIELKDRNDIHITEADNGGGLWVDALNPEYSLEDTTAAINEVFQRHGLGTLSNHDWRVEDVEGHEDGRFFLYEGQSLRGGP